jgi:hypothetical protein
MPVPAVGEGAMTGAKAQLVKESVEALARLGYPNEDGAE